jgi:hypothetical protein
MKTLLASFTAVLAVSRVLAAEPEFKPIFNGKDFTGWKGDGYLVEDNAIYCTPKGHNLITDKVYTNYILDFEFLLTPGANNGLGIHYPGTGDSAYTGMELQILEDTHPKYKDLKDYQFHGSLYTLAPAKRGAQKPVGEWNHQVVTVNGPSVKVVLNDITILDANLEELAKTHPDHKGVVRREGYIGFLGHGDRVGFRNIKLAELPASTK